jgi:hypothetical protein
MVVLSACFRSLVLPSAGWDVAKFCAWPSQIESAVQLFELALSPEEINVAGTKTGASRKGWTNCASGWQARGER